MLVPHQHATSDPTTTDLVRRSAAALHAKHLVDAEAMARTAIARDAAHIPARLALGRALEAQGRHAEAAAVYAEAARISPYSPGVSRSLRRVWVAPLAGFGIVSGILLLVVRLLGREFDEHTVLLALLISVGALIAGTVFVLWDRHRRFASLSPEDRALIRAHGDAGGLLAMPAPGRLLFVGVVIVSLSVASILFALGTKYTVSLKVGDCFTLDRVTSIEHISAIPCDLPHGTEVYATVDDPSPPGAPYPGIDVVRAGAASTCAAAYTTFIGAPYTTLSRFHIFVLSPEQSYWDVGVRMNICTVQDPRAHQTTGSAKGTGR
jgi:Septum formation